LALFGFVFSLPSPAKISVNHCNYVLCVILPSGELALFFQINLNFSLHFSTISLRQRRFFCHPEAQPKDLAIAQSKPHRTPDSSPSASLRAKGSFHSE
jgi:hypothetical protein